MADPQATVRLEPLIQSRERACFDLVDALLRRRLAGNEASVAQHFQVLGHRRLADHECVDELADAAAGASEPVEYPAPGRLGEYGKRVNGHDPNMPLLAYACQGLYRAQGISTGTGDDPAGLPHHGDLVR